MRIKVWPDTRSIGVHAFGRYFSIQPARQLRASKLFGDMYGPWRRYYFGPIGVRVIER